MRHSTLIVFVVFLSALKGYCQSTKAVYADSSFIAQILQQHQTYRDALQLPALSWSPALAKDALAWAQHLASVGKGEHDMDIRGKEGENLWWGTAGAYSYAEMVGMWGSEKRSFRYDTYPNCTTHRSAVVGHYTQMVWKNTQFVGCALSSNGQTDFLVCRYSPAGNIVGGKPY